MQKRLSIFSFFSGAGILDLAFEKNGYDVVFVNEFDSQFLEAYKYARTIMHMKSPVYGYVNGSAEKFAKKKGKQKLIELVEQERKKGNLVGFIGGPPCPDFSVAGKNAGATGENGKLTKTYFDIICRCKPDFYLFENVKGLVRTTKHKSFYKQMKMKVMANGYTVSDCVINALAYGVPQYRERVFMVGVSHDLLGENAGCDEQKELGFAWGKHCVFDTMSVLHRHWPTTREFAEDSQCDFAFKNIPKKLTVEYWFKKNDVTRHPNSTDTFAVKEGQQKITTIPEGDTSGKSFKRLHRWRFSPTAAYGHNEVHLHPYKKRRISVAEAMAIQSIPKEFVIMPSVTLSKKFKMIGNGVPYLMAAAIAKTLKEFLYESLEENG